MERVKRTYNPCDDCEYSYSKNNQESNICKICEFKTYFDADRQGKLIILPCKVGGTVWKISRFLTGSECDDLPDVWYRIEQDNFTLSMLGYYGKTIFLTKEETEQALAKMKEV